VRITAAGGEQYGLLELVGPMHGLEAILAFGVLAVLRIGAACIVAPFLAGRWVPWTVRGAVALLLSLALAPVVAFPGLSVSEAVAASTDAITTTVSGFVGLMVVVTVQELLIGATLGMIAGFVFYGMEAAGHLLETRFLGGIEHRVESESALGYGSTSLAAFLSIAGIVVFMSLRGHMLFIAALARSFELFPLGALFDSSSIYGQSAMSLAARSGELVLVAAAMAIPVAIPIIAVDFAAALSTRIAPLLKNVLPVHALRGMLGMMLLAVALGVLLVPIFEDSAALMRHIAEFLGPRHHRSQTAGSLTPIPAPSPSARPSAPSPSARPSAPSPSARP